MGDNVQRMALTIERYHNEHCDVFHSGDLAELLAAESPVGRDELLAFATWVLKDEFGEGHEDEIVDRYLASLA